MKSKREFEDDMREELHLHVEMRAKDLEREGYSPEDALRQARIEFGAVERYKEEGRAAAGWRPFDEVRQDLSYAWRQLRRAPGFALASVAILAIGIGANTAIFSVVEAIMMRSLPVKDPQELHLIEWRSAKTGFRNSYNGSNRGDLHWSISYPAYQYLRDHTTSFDGFAAMEPNTSNVNLTVGGQARLVRGLKVSGNYFEVLGVDAGLGRVLTPDDDRATALAPAAVLSHDFWQSSLAADPAVIGRKLPVNGVPFTVVGIAPPGFFGTDPEDDPQIYLPMASHAWLEPESKVLREPRSWWFLAIGRLKTGVRPERAAQDTEAALQAAIRLDPPAEEYDQPKVSLKPMERGWDSVRNELQRPLQFVSLAVGMLLLIGCANIAGLLLARSTVRRREIGTRLAIGAGRWRLIRQLLTESLMLSVAGGALGLGIAYLVTANPEATLGLNDTTLDLRPNTITLAVSIGLCLLTSLLFGLAPAFSATRIDLASMLKQQSESMGRRGGRTTARKALVAFQVALSLMLAASAGVFVRSVINLRSEKLGFRPDHLLVFKLDGTSAGYKEGRLLDLYENALRAVEAVPGVRSASMTRHPLIAGGTTSSGIEVPGFNKPWPANRVFIHYIAPRFFETTSTALLQGRDVAWRDREGAPKVVIVNEAFVRHFYPGANPVGKTVGGDRPGPDKPPERMEIVGVVADAKYSNLRREVPPTIYLPYRQHSQNQMTFTVRAIGDPLSIADGIRRAIAKVEPNVPIFEMRTQYELIDRSIARERYLAFLLTIFGVLALLMAALGIYGTLAFTVARRTPEIGIRMALGADRWDVVVGVVREALVPVGVGIAAGLLGAFWATRLAEKMLFGVKPNDPATLAAAVIALVLVALAAAWIPARRASRIAPMSALRYD